MTKDAEQLLEQFRADLAKLSHDDQEAVTEAVWRNVREFHPTLLWVAEDVANHFETSEADAHEWLAFNGDKLIDAGIEAGWEAMNWI